MEKLLMLLASNKLIRIHISLLLALSGWLHYQGIRVIEKRYRVPCCFYNQEQRVIYEAPESLEIDVRGTRNILQMIKEEDLAIHIDALSLKKGKQRLVITAQDLFLPEAIKLVNWKPINAFVTVD